MLPDVVLTVTTPVPVPTAPARLRRPLPPPCAIVIGKSHLIPPDDERASRVNWASAANLSVTSPDVLLASIRDGTAVKAAFTEPDVECSVESPCSALTRTSPLVELISTVCAPTASARTVPDV